MKYLKKFESDKFELKFKVGDTVKCVDNIGAYLLKRGNLYKVSKIYINKFTTDIFLYFNEISVSSGWSEDRFRKATEEEESQYKYNL